MNKIIWEDLPKSQSLFTKRNATMRDLRTKKIIQYYSANTKISLAQKANYGLQTYYRTASARDNDLDWAFEASAFGLPNEIAPPIVPHTNSFLTKQKPVSTSKPVKKQKSEKKLPQAPKGGEVPHKKKGLFSRLFKFSK